MNQDNDYISADKDSKWVTRESFNSEVELPDILKRSMANRKQQWISNLERKMELAQAMELSEDEVRKRDDVFRLLVKKLEVKLEIADELMELRVLNENRQKRVLAVLNKLNQLKREK